MHGENITYGNWSPLIIRAFNTDPDLKTFLRETNDNYGEELPATAAIDALGSLLGRSIKAILP